MKSNLSPRVYKVQHNWNTYPYLIELLACFGSDTAKWFVRTPAETVMICDPDHKRFLGFWLYTPTAELGFNTAEEALIGFDAAMTHRYRGV